MNLEPDVDIIDATPSKRIYQSIIADYGLKTAVCELIDNAIDARKTVKHNIPLKVIIDIDIDQQSIMIEDNACGVPKDELKKLISPGETSSDGIEGAIGVFGVGSKRAAVALAQHIQIKTRCENNRTYLIEYDDAWLRSDEWNLLYSTAEDIDENTTQIELSKLRFKIDENAIEDLRTHLEIIYAIFIKDCDVQIVLNDELIKSKFFDQWAFPPEYTPTTFIRSLVDFKTQKRISFNLTCGLTYEKGSVGGDFGVFIYCNKRLVTRALRDPEVGFITGIAGVPHPDHSLARVIVELSGASNQMPWISNKRGINYNHPTFKLIQEDIIQVVKNSTSFSKRLKKNSATRVEPFKEGIIREINLGITGKIPRSKLAPIPKARTNYKDGVISLNKALGVLKPWTKGLYESLIAEELISHRKELSQKNRISLILLDSTVEIGCKEYLVKELPISISEKKLREMSRVTIQNEVEKYILTGDDIWKRFRHYYYDRCYLIHGKASVGISDVDIQQFREDVKLFLNVAFGINFPSD